MNKIKYCVWVRQRNYSTARQNGAWSLWRYCEFLESARYYAGVARYKETEALISTWEKSKAFLEK